MKFIFPSNLLDVKRDSEHGRDVARQHLIS